MSLNRKSRRLLKGVPEEGDSGEEEPGDRALLFSGGGAASKSNLKIGSCENAL